MNMSVHHVHTDQPQEPGGLFITLSKDSYTNFLPNFLLLVEWIEVNT